MVVTVEIASILRVGLVPTVQIRSEWCRSVEILLPATIPFGLVGEFEMAAPAAAYVFPIGFLTPESEIILITNEQKSSSLVFPFEPHTSALSKLLPTIIPSQKLRLHKRR